MGALLPTPAAASVAVATAALRPTDSPHASGPAVLLTVCAESVVCLQWGCWGGDRRAGAACTQGARAAGPVCCRYRLRQCTDCSAVHYHWLHSLPWPQATGVLRGARVPHARACAQRYVLHDHAHAMPVHVQVRVTDSALRAKYPSQCSSAEGQSSLRAEGRGLIRPLPLPPHNLDLSPPRSSRRAAARECLIYKQTLKFGLART